MDELTQRVVKTLRSSPVSQIWFRAGSLHVVAFKYRYVADCIENGSISVGVGGLTDDTRVAEYQHFGPITKPRFAIKDGDAGTGSDGASGRATFVHEATHAGLDVTMAGKLISSMQNEFCAYFAEFIYLCAAGAAGDQGAQSELDSRSQGFLYANMVPMARQAIACSDVFAVPPEQMNKCVTFIKFGYPNTPDQERMLGLAPSLPPMVPDP